MKSIRIGRRRKVFKQAKAHISFTGKAVTSHAGMAVVARAFESFDLVAKLRAATARLDKGSRYRTGQILEQLIALRIMGGEAVSDLALMDEPALEAMFGWDSIAHASSFSRRLKRFSYRDTLELEKIVTDLSRPIQAKHPALIAIDSTVSTVFGHKIQGAERGYNPHKPGRNSYHPLVAVDIASRSVIDGYLRPGSCSSGDGLDGFVRKIMAESNRRTQDIVLRLDKGLTSGSVLDTIERLGAGYVAKVKLTANVAGQISKTKKWRSIGTGHFAANFNCRLDGWSKSRRFAVIERHLPPKDADRQLSLFDFMDGRYEVVVTNLHLNAENIWRLYNRGAIVEQVIEEIKNDYSATGIRTDSFWANDALFMTGLIAYNLVNCIRRMALPRRLRTARIKRLGFLLLHLPANVVARSRQLLIKIKRDHPSRLIFYRAMAAMR